MEGKKPFKAIFRYKETECTIIGDDQRTVESAMSAIKHYRKELEEYVRNHPRFSYSLIPVKVDEGPLVAKLMADAAEEANVGPMAAVAGVLADLAVKDMVLRGSEVAVVENGGEVSAVSNQPVDLALLARDSPLSGTFGFRLKDFPEGVATSSGQFSHAFSFGNAEVVTIFCKHAGLADAAATAVGNLVGGKDPHRAIERGIERALSIQGVEGAFIMYRGLIGKAGRIPQIIKLSTEKTTTPFLEFLKSHMNPIIQQTSEVALGDSCDSDLHKC